MPRQKKYLTAKEAAKKLDVGVTTLYAYVSRGMIQSEETGHKRQKRYLLEDVERLLERKELRRNPDKAIQADVLKWEGTVLESEITLIEDDRLYYRGQDAVGLAKNSTIEKVAEIIWQQEVFSLPNHSFPKMKMINELSPLESFLSQLPSLANQDIASYTLAPSPVAKAGRNMMHSFLSLITQKDIDNSIAKSLQVFWAPKKKEMQRILDAAFILCADHELNVSSFTARCVASAGTNPYGVVTAGISALQGFRHGGSSERTLAFLHEVAQQKLATVLMTYLKRGENIPGFGHKLYPSGDPRGKALLEMLTETYPRNSKVKMCQEIIAAVYESTGEYPNIDLALAALADILDLGKDGAINLFFMGRLVGWIGHALEQYKKSHLIRPRAKYIGILPE